MKIYYREKSGGIEILRCFGIEGRVEIPGMIDGKLVISAAPYAFSSHMDEKEELKNASLWEVSEGLGFGREEHVLAGNDVEEIVFPYTLKEIGRYIFYGCGNLKKLTIHMRQGKKSGVKEMLGEMWQRIDVNFLYEYEEARLVFPEHYDEAVENTPARILYTEYHGSGSNYRQCFYDKELNYQEYDRLFEMAVAMDKLEVLVDMSFGRLEFPYELTGKARENYREYIRKNLGDIAEYLVKQEDMHRLEVISSQKLWTLEGIDSALDCASKRKETEVSAFLMNERANLVDNTAGSERIDVDKLQNSQEADRTEQGKNEQSQTTEKSLNRRTILRKKRFEL